MTELSTEYIFLNSLQRGLNVYLSDQPAAGASRSTIDVRARITRRQTNGSESTVSTASKPVQVYGPGDVVGFDPALVSRTEPRHDIAVMDFEPNYFPFIELGEPDFAWRFSPIPPDDDKRVIAPWIGLIVLEETEFTEGEAAGAEQPFITVHPRIFDADAESGEQGGSLLPLPDLTHGSLWAHVQVVGSASAGLIDHRNVAEGQFDSSIPASRVQDVANILRSSPGRSACRLLCPRRLEPKRKYTAFVVPTYASGVAAGLGMTIPTGTGAIAPAWQVDDAHDLDLPYYFKWTFGTGLRGDFEYAARQLDPTVLDSIGKRPLDVSEPGYDLPPASRAVGNGETTTLLGAEGALRSREFEAHSANEGFEAALASLLNREQPLQCPNPYFSDVFVAFDEWGSAARLRWNTPDAVQCSVTVRGETGGTTEDQRHRFEIDSLEPGAEHIVDISAIGAGESSQVRFTAPAGPEVRPPVYGHWHVGARWLEATERPDYGWLESLNLDPRYRVAAGLGAALVNKHQEALMASAWDQLGEVVSANDIIQQNQVGHTISTAHHERLTMLAKLSPGDAALTTSPLHSRTRLSTCEKYRDAVGQGRLGLTPRIHFANNTSVPQSLFDRGFHRLQGARSTVRRRQRSRGDASKMLQRFDDDKNPLQLTEVPCRTPSYSMEGMEERLFEGRVTTKVPPEVLGEIDPELVPDKPDEGHGEEPGPDPLPLDEVVNAMLCALDPDHTFCAQLQARIDLAGTASEDRDCLDRIMAYPKFPQPLYAALSEMSQEYIAPGLADVPQNTVGLLQTNREFIEAFFAGFNHAFGAELLWREYPTDQRGSYARQFWDPSDFLIPGLSNDDEEAAEQREVWKEWLKDIRPLHEWAGQLGDHGVPLDTSDVSVPITLPDPDAEVLEEKVVLVIRGDLLKKYPDTRIYAVRAIALEVPDPDADDSDPQTMQKIVPDLVEFGGTGAVTTPVFTGRLAPDITLLGFPLDEEDARGDDDEHGYFFVFEGRPMQTRFGFDEPTPEDEDSAGPDDQDGASDDVCAPTSDDNLTWGNVGLLASHVDPANVTDPDSSSPNWAGITPAMVARKTFQKAFRLSIHARELLPSTSAS